MARTPIKIGVIGASGYTGGELIRLLLRHPAVELRSLYSRTHAGKAIAEIHSDLLGECDLKFSSELAGDLDVLFLCLGHGESKKFLQDHAVEARVKIIDLSQDFRGPNEHGFVYGLPELQRDSLRQAARIANPGCFATCIQLALLPLAKEHKLRDEIHVSAITGSTGAGQALSETTHFTWRSNNLSVYKAFEHQHLAEIRQSLRALQPGWNAALNFIPMRGAFTRGILAAVYLQCDLTLEQANDLYTSYYAPHPFAHVTRRNPDVKQVVNTNNCVLYLEKHNDKLLIVSVLDNLLKGASGQAVQNMNLMFGLEETLGLRLKAVAF
jgi:N-acetyl-gamma-glutamyl-phosphate reductase